MNPKPIFVTEREEEDESESSSHVHTDEMEGIEPEDVEEERILEDNSDLVKQPEFETPRGPEEEEQIEEIVCTPKKNVRPGYKGLGIDVDNESKLSPQKFSHAPEKLRELQPQKISPTKKVIFKIDRKARQFTSTGQFKEVMRTKNHILKLLMEDRKGMQKSIENKIKRIEVLNNGLASVSAQLKSVQEDFQELPSKN